MGQKRKAKLRSKAAQPNQRLNCSATKSKLCGPGGDLALVVPTLVFRKVVPLELGAPLVSAIEILRFFELLG